MIDIRTRLYLLKRLKEGGYNGSYVEAISNAKEWVQRMQSGGEVGEPVNPGYYPTLAKITNYINSDKNWVRRGMNMEDYPAITNPDGSIATHELATASGDNTNYVFPTIVQSPVSGGLERIKSMRDSRIDPIEIKDKNFAEWYSRYGLINRNPDIPLRYARYKMKNK